MIAISLGKRALEVLACGLMVFLAAVCFGAAGGTISGTVHDPSGAVVPGASLTLRNTGMQTVYTTKSDGQGLFSFPSVPVGQYDLTTEATGFQTQTKAGIAVDTDAALNLDIALQIGNQTTTVQVASGGTAQVDTIATHLGELVTGSQMTALPLNGRSYTDLLAIQPGVAPISSLTPSSVIMAGVTGSINPSGDLDAGNLSINGQRESSNGFMVNGVDVQEHMNGGTSIIPNLDSIDEFRVLTNNFDPEYGNYNGGMVTVITKSGSNAFHGNAFEFFRNTNLDARGYFDPTRPSFDQNQFGGTLGGPIRRNKIFFFADYQGTRTTQGIPTGDISVPSLAQRNGNFADPSTGLSTLTGKVSGSYLAGLLTGELGRPVTAGEPYASVFPGGFIPQSAWSAPGRNLLQYIPSPNVSTNQFSSSAYAQTVRDDKGAARIDSNSRYGQLSAYYFIDDYRLDNPYPGSVAGASIPGFDALTIGRAQLISLGDTKVVGANAVNEFHLGYLRWANIVGQPHGGLGVSMASQGFVSGAGTPGIYVQAPQYEGVENITFPTFVMGVPVTNLIQVNNTIYLSDGFSRVFGSNTIKFGGQFHIDEVNEHPNGTFNGTFNISGSETGSSYADFLIGVPSNYTQSSGGPFYLRNRYEGLYVQDSWRARSNLTINAGIRWDVIMPFWEKYNQLQTYIPGAQSVLFPGAPPGLVVPGDPGIPKTIAPTQYTNFAPRLGIAYSPGFNEGLLNRIFGSRDQSSIRASYGVFYTAFPGLNTGIAYGVPPFGYNYLSPAPPLFATPFITASTGVDNGQRFPFPFPPHNVSAKHPDASVNWANLLPISADPFFNYRNRAPYIESYIFSFQRQITQDALLTVSYAGNQGHHVLAVVSANPGNQALCLSLSQPNEVAPGTATCGPYGEDSPYVSASGKTYRGTRQGQGPDYGENTSDSSIANSNYNALETTLRYTHAASQFLLSYTYSKSIDQGSNLGEQLDPLNLRHTRAISAFDMRHDFVASYVAELPFERWAGHEGRWMEGWSLSGDIRFSTGFPVTLYDNSDNSLLGTLGNGVNNYLLDTPQFTPGPLKINTNGHSSRPAFNTSLFHEETLGQLGNAKRRFFYGPGIENFDMTLQKTLPLADGRALEFRTEAFNLFNHAQFYGPSAVDGQIEDPNFGQIVAAQAPRLIQLAMKFSF